jgi:hypothetical protein
VLASLAVARFLASNLLAKRDAERAWTFTRYSRHGYAFETS